MARNPIPIINNISPFTEGAPPDDLQIEAINQEEVLIGDPALDEIVEQDSTFDENLVEQISQKELNRKASDLIKTYETDLSSRSEWEDKYKDGLKTLDADGGLTESEEQRASRGLSTVIHPLISEAATQFNAKAIAELYPSGGPVKTVIVGEPNEELEEQAKRVRDFMNYQITSEMPEYFPDLDQMLFHLPLVGQAFKKVWWDPEKNRQMSLFVKAEDFVVAPDANDLKTASRYTQIIRMSKNDFNKYVDAGFYEPSDFDGEGLDPAGATINEIEGLDAYDSEGKSEMMTLLEMHIYEQFDGLDGFEGKEDNNEVAIPYVVTIDYEAEKVVSIRRNWKEDDERKER